MKKAVQSVVYLIAGVGFGIFTWRSLMMAVWGAPVSPVQYVALFSSIGLVLAAVVSLGLQNWGRILGIISVIGIGVLYVPATVIFVSLHGTIISPTGYFLVIGYFAILAFVLFFPSQRKLSVLALACVLAVSGGIVGNAYFGRLSKGEFSWPTIECFGLVQGPGPNSRRQSLSMHSRDVILSLNANGIRGVLVPMARVPQTAAKTTLAVVCAEQPEVEKKLFFPKHGILIYIYERKEWRTIPPQPDLFNGFVTLRRDGMISDGRGTALRGFFWSRTFGVERSGTNAAVSASTKVGVAKVPDIGSTGLNPPRVPVKNYATFTNPADRNEPPRWAQKIIDYGDYIRAADHVSLPVYDAKTRKTSTITASRGPSFATLANVFSKAKISPQSHVFAISADTVFYDGINQPMLRLELFNFSNGSIVRLNDEDYEIDRESGEAMAEILKGMRELRR